MKNTGGLEKTVKIKNLSLLIFIFIVAFTDCKKDENSGDNWENCYSCTADNWVGWYSGTANYFNAINNTTVSGLSVSVRVEETATDYLTVYLTVPVYYSATVSGSFSSPYVLSFGGSSTSIAALMYIKDNQFRLTGNSKKYHYKVDSLIIEQVINFETYKDQ